MANKIKGNTTKSYILDIAKHEFYEKGYTNAQVKNIALKANLSLGNLTYYFKKKDDMVKAIYEQTINEIYGFIEEYYSSDELLKYSSFTVIMYNTILSDKNNIRFYNEVIKFKSNSRVLHEALIGYYIKMVEQSQINFDGNDFDVFLLREFGSRREILLSYLNGSLNISKDELIRYLVEGTFRWLNIDDEHISDLLSQSNEFLNGHDYSHIKLLV